MRRLPIVLLAMCIAGMGAGTAALAQSPSASPPAGPLRVAMPEAGLAATFPAGWVIEASGGESFAVSPDRGTRCLTTTEWFDEPIDDPRAFLDQVAAIYPGLSDDGPLPIIESSEIELPEGRAIVFIVDLTRDPEFDARESEGARYLTSYILADELRLLFLSCWSPERAADDWRSVAETIEFLPGPP